MTDQDRKAAMEWLEAMAADGSIASMGARERCRVALAMLAEPRLPVEPNAALIVHFRARMMQAGTVGDANIAEEAIVGYHYALHAHLSKPPEPKPADQELGPLLPPRLRFNRGRLQYWSAGWWRDVPEV